MSSLILAIAVPPSILFLLADRYTILREPRVIPPPPDVDIIIGYGDTDAACHTLIQQLRALTAHPILILTPRPSDITRIACLRAGADAVEAVDTPPAVLTARIDAMVRRWHMPVSPSFAGDSLAIRWNPRVRQITWSSGTVHLSPSEATIFHALVAAPSRTLRTTTLCRIGKWTRPNTLAVIIANLRRKFTRAGTPLQIRTIARVGYQIVGEARAESRSDSV